MKMSIDIVFFTLVLDGMPWITRHLQVFEQLPFTWRWFVLEGVAAPENCTSWCAPLEPRLSNDGTTGYLDSINDPRVVVLRSEYWHGKVHMCNAPLRYLFTPCLLWQVDSDEIWTPEQIKAVVALFATNPTKNCAYFYCDYRVGPNLRIQGREGYGNNKAYEWLRVWRWNRGLRFKSHEPPVLDNFEPRPITHEETEKAGAVFRHEAYSTEKQVAFKERYYGSEANQAGAKYRGAVRLWHQLQRQVKFPVDLNKFLPWVGEGTLVERV